ncbi:hypothetical protein NPIL_389161 [Nephila pilipes]|uniref:Uncharacterized protein n=1 Tax=Nephila pilipes TaxID=299642 RepID=A0A8X6QL04_NEPPI|nr:hypothetical protein NPIL_389161 [Nephila pilipes]
MVVRRFRFGRFGVIADVALELNNCCSFSVRRLCSLGIPIKESSIVKSGERGGFDNTLLESTCLARSHRKDLHHDGMWKCPILLEIKLFLFKILSNTWYDRLLQQVQSK